MHTRCKAWRIGVLVVLFAVTGGLGSAESPDAGRSTAQVTPLGVADDQTYHYAVKYVCGGYETAGVIQGGIYDTNINILNYTTDRVLIYMRPAVGYLDSVPTPGMSRLGHEYVPARRTLIIDCATIKRLEARGVTPTEGLVHISTDTKLPVVAVYVGQGHDSSSGDPIEAGEATIHVEQYEPFLELVSS